MNKKRIKEIFEMAFKDKDIKDPSLGSKILMFISTHPKNIPLKEEIIVNLKTKSPVSEKEIKNKIEELEDKNVVKIYNKNKKEFIYYTEEGWRFCVDTRIYQDGLKLRKHYEKINTTEKMKKLLDVDRPENIDIYENPEINSSNYDKYKDLI